LDLAEIIRTAKAAVKLEGTEGQCTRHELYVLALELSRVELPQGA
jgi:hypothetical protein